MPSAYFDVLSELHPRIRTVTVGDVETKVWEYGDPDAQETAVLVHGFRGDHHGLEVVVGELLRRRAIKIIAPDLPGFGESAALSAGHSLADYVGWLGAFISEVSNRPVLIGHSFGSIVTSAAVADGLDVSELVLINPIGAPALEGPRGVLTRLAVFYYWLGAKLPERLGTGLLRSKLIVRVMSNAMVKSKDRAIRSFAHDQHDRYFSLFADRETLKQAFVTSVSHDVSDAAGAIGVRTLLIAAEKDDITSIDKVRVLSTKFADAELVEIPKVGHLIHYETPAEAAQAIDDFLTARV